ncbi:hypothetical protein HK405_000501, partial [Cladochytrium tenue]
MDRLYDAWVSEMGRVRVRELKVEIVSSRQRDASPLFRTQSKTTSVGRTLKRDHLVFISTSAGVITHGLVLSEYLVFASTGEPSTQHILHIDRVDSTGVPSVGGCLRPIVAAVIRGLMSCGSFCQPQTKRQVQVHLFARSQPQYLFHLSSENKEKRVLTDRQLVAWWIRTLSECACVDSIEWGGNWMVPGLDHPDLAPSELRRSVDTCTNKIRWAWGLGAPKAAIAAECVPSFADDIKSKAMGMLAPEATVSELLEAMAITGEAGSGRVVGVLKLSGLTGTQPLHPDSLETSAVDASADDDNAVVNALRLLMRLDFSTKEKTSQASAELRATLTGTILFRTFEIRSADQEQPPTSGSVSIGPQSVKATEKLTPGSTSEPRVNNLQSLVKRKRPPPSDPSFIGGKS